MKRGERILVVTMLGFWVLLIGATLGSILFSPPETTHIAAESPTKPEGVSAEVVTQVDTKLVEYQSMVAELTAKYQGQEYAIAVKHFADPTRDFAVNGDRSMSAASTYKLFTAYTMLKSGYAPSCLETMIINSDNACPENYGNWWGTTTDARALGATNTDLNSVITTTTANDLVIFLTKLYDGSLLAPADNERLLNAMKIQIFREGIPSGIPDALVANKVGFLDGVLNDAAIVYSPKGDFALVILTDGYSWQSIAETTAEIYAKM